MFSKAKLITIITHPIFFYTVVLLATSVSFYASYYYKDDVFLKALFNNVATGLFAASFISFLFERLNRKNQQKYLASIEKAQAFNLLRTIIPEQIFTEVNKYIIEEKFLRYNCRGFVELKHFPAHNEFLIMNDRYEFIVENLRHSTEEYELYIFEDWIFEIDNIGTKILDVIIKEEDSEGHYLLKSTFSWETLKTQGFISFNKKEKRIELLKKIKIEAKKKIKLIIRTQSIREIKDFFPYIMTEPTTDLTVEFSFPQDIDITAFPLHPNSERFDERIDDPTKKTWSIDSGILPYQGIQISWTSRSNRQYTVNQNNIASIEAGVQKNIFLRFINKLLSIFK